MITIGILGLLISIILLITLMWKNWNMSVSALICSVVVIAFNQMNLFEMMSQCFWTDLSGFVESWGGQFIVSSIFGKIMQESKAATGIADSMLKLFGKRSAILIVMISGLVLSYCGIGTFTIAFSIYPIAYALFKSANISKRLIVATIMVCPVTVCMTMLPGSPSIQNLIPTQYFDTSIYAGYKIGVVCSVLMFISAYLYLVRQEKILKRRGCCFEMYANEYDRISDTAEKDDMPETWKCYIPIGVVSGMILCLQFIFKLSSSHSVICALITGIAVSCILFRNYVSVKMVINEGSVNGVSALVSTASIMGFGAIVSSSPAYQSIVGALMNIQSNPLLSAIVSINVIAAVTGSSAGGLNIYLSTLGETLLESGLDTSMLHRVTCIASSGFDAMPHASGIVLCNQVAKTSQRETYKYVFVTCAIIPFCYSVLSALIGSLGII